MKLMQNLSNYSFSIRDRTEVTNKQVLKRLKLIQWIKRWMIGIN